MYLPAMADFETVWTLARVRAEQEGRPRCRTGQGLRIKPLGIDRIGAATDRGGAQVGRPR